MGWWPNGALACLLALSVAGAAAEAGPTGRSDEKAGKSPSSTTRPALPAGAGLAGGRSGLNVLGAADSEQVTFRTAGDLDQLVISGGAWSVENEELIGTCAGDRSWATVRTYFKRLDSVSVRARLVPPSTRNLRMWVGPILLIFNWEMADQNHYRNNQALTVTRPHALTPGRWYDIELRQAGDKVVVTVDDEPVYETEAILRGTVSVQSAWKSTIAVRRIVIHGEPDPTVSAAPVTRNLPGAPPDRRRQGAAARPDVTYEEAFRDLHETIGARYPCFKLKGIDWTAVGAELLPRAATVKSDDEFGLLCMELLARLEDSHAHLLNESARVPAPPLPQWGPGFACLEDDRGQPVVYYADKGGPAEAAGVRVGMTVLSVGGQPVSAAIDETMKQRSTYFGYSSLRYLRYHAHRFFPCRMEQGTIVQLEMENTAGKKRTFKLPATLGRRYVPRLPVPIDGIGDSTSVSWKMLDERIGYVYVRRISRDLIASLDRAVGQLQRARGLIIDVRGNSGGGFDGRRAFLNFALDQDEVEPDRPRFKGPIAVLIDSRCISAGEGWASWFVAKRRATFFGQTTAGASARKINYLIKNGLYRARFPVKAYRGFLRRPIERKGLEPDVPLRQNANDLAQGRDTVLKAAKKFLLTRTADAAKPEPTP